MIKIRKTFKTHARELVAVILLKMASKIAPHPMKTLFRITALKAANISRAENIYIKGLR
jgi:hypothetical protein